jgi:hypothetical protein
MFGALQAGKAKSDGEESELDDDLADDPAEARAGSVFSGGGRRRRKRRKRGRTAPGEEMGEISEVLGKIDAG